MAVQIGFVEKWRPLGSPVGEPYDTRLGGLPSFFGEEFPTPVCADCKRPLFLMAQVYAPTEVERNLLVFGCNSAVCNAFDGRGGARHGSWVVLRSQGGAAPAEVVSVAAAATTADVDAAGSGAAAAAPTAAAAGGGGDDWGSSGEWGATGGWGAADDAAAAPSAGAVAAASSVASAVAAPAAAAASAGVPTAASVSAASDAAPSRPAAAAAKKPAASAAAAAEGGAGKGPRFAFPAYHVDTCEHWENDGPGSDDDDSDTDDEEGGDVSGKHSKTKAPASMMGGWSAPTTAPGSAAAAGSGSAAAAPADADDGDDDDAGDAGGDDGADDDDGIDGSGKAGSAAAAGDAGGEKYERVPAKVRYMLRFQRALRYMPSPSSVVRYAYGDQPLWPVPPPRGGLKVPACKCGAKRVFEMQLLPPMLEGMRVDEWTAESIERAAGAAGAAAAAGGAAAGSAGKAPAAGTPAGVHAIGGVDFFTVMVFSCPASCGSSHEEYVHFVGSDASA